MPRKDTRSVLRYLAEFRGQVFSIWIDEALLEEPILSDALLDIATMQAVGISCLIGVLGEGREILLKRALEAELPLQDWSELQQSEGVPDQIKSDQEAVKETLYRGQVLLMPDWSKKFVWDGEFFAGLGVSKFITLLKPAKEISPTQTSINEPNVRNKVIELTHFKQAEEWIDFALSACQKGLNRIHLLDGSKESSLVDELFSNYGVGIMISTDPYKTIMPLSKEVIPELLAMMGPSMSNSSLLLRSYDKIEQKITYYYMLMIDRQFVGAAALYPYPEEQVAEIESVIIKKPYQGLGYGLDLVRYVEKMAQEQGFSRVFAVTTQAQPFFETILGYQVTSPEQLPKTRFEVFQKSKKQNKNPKILFKTLTLIENGS